MCITPSVKRKNPFNAIFGSSFYENSSRCTRGHVSQYPGTARQKIILNKVEATELRFYTSGLINKRNTSIQAKYDSRKFLSRRVRHNGGLPKMDYLGGLFTG
jgi:hypothetical protein